MDSEFFSQSASLLWCSHADDRPTHCAHHHVALLETRRAVGAERQLEAIGLSHGSPVNDFWPSSCIRHGFDRISKAIGWSFQFGLTKTLRASASLFGCGGCEYETVASIMNAIPANKLMRTPMRFGKIMMPPVTADEFVSLVGQDHVDNREQNAGPFCDATK